MLENSSPSLSVDLVISESHLVGHFHTEVGGRDRVGNLGEPMSSLGGKDRCEREEGPTSHG